MALLNHQPSTCGSYIGFDVPRSVQLWEGRVKPEIFGIGAFSIVTSQLVLIELQVNGWPRRWKRPLRGREQLDFGTLGSGVLPLPLAAACENSTSFSSAWELGLFRPFRATTYFTTLSTAAHGNLRSLASSASGYPCPSKAKAKDDCRVMPPYTVQGRTSHLTAYLHNLTN